MAVIKVEKIRKQKQIKDGAGSIPREILDKLNKE